MPVNFAQSKTRENLMRAFAGESQARNRYTFGESICRKQQLYVLADLFKFTADQEKAHAWIFYNHIVKNSGSEGCSPESVDITGSYPVDLSSKPEDLLCSAHHNEQEEFENVYPAFAAAARDEGFGDIAQDFENIAKIEKCHGERFNTFHSLMQEGRLFSDQQPQTWLCMNCGYILEGTQAPEKCPVCDHPQGYYIRLEMTPWGCCPAEQG